MRLLNVGGGITRSVPSIYEGWDQDLLDINPDVKPDICCDAKDLFTLPRQYDAVLCAHNLEHFYIHEVPRVLCGFWHVLKDEGFADIIVPDIGALIEGMRGKDIHDQWYLAGDTPISFHDVLYGWTQQIAAGNEYYSHKTGFTAASLNKALMFAGFPQAEIYYDGLNIRAKAHKCR